MALVDVGHTGGTRERAGFGTTSVEATADHRALLARSRGTEDHQQFVVGGAVGDRSCAHDGTVVTVEAGEVVGVGGESRVSGHRSRSSESIAAAVGVGCSRSMGGAVGESTPVMTPTVATVATAATATALMAAPHRFTAD